MNVKRKRNQLQAIPTYLIQETNSIAIATYSVSYLSFSLLLPTSVQTSHSDSYLAMGIVQVVYCDCVSYMHDTYCTLYTLNQPAPKLKLIYRSQLPSCQVTKSKGIYNYLLKMWRYFQAGLLYVHRSCFYFSHVGFDFTLRLM